MATNDGGPAFPCRVVEHEDGCFVDVDYTGVSIRDYMAAKAMQGMLANHEFNMTHSATSASLRAEVERLTAELQGERDDLANARKWIDGQDVRSDLPTATEMRHALDRERERCGVLEREVRAYREWQRTKCDDNTSSLDHWHACKALDAATLETDTRHALDAAKFGKEQNDG